MHYPLDLIKQGYGIDALRVYEYFIGPYDLDANWEPRGIVGTYRFLNRVWTLVQEYKTSEHNFSGNDDAVSVLRHKVTRKVTSDLHRLSFNTAVSALMEYVNELYKLKLDGFSDGAWQDALETLARLLGPFAPHIAEELHVILGGTGLIQRTDWPSWDDKAIVEEMVTVIVQVNGKLRAKLDVSKDISEEDATALALNDPNVQVFVGNKKPAKIIYVPGRLVSIVV